MLVPLKVSFNKKNFSPAQLLCYMQGQVLSPALFYGPTLHHVLICVRPKCASVWDHETLGSLSVCTHLCKICELYAHTLCH